MSLIEFEFRTARWCILQAIDSLQDAIEVYEKHPDLRTRKARIDALKGKIDYLNGLQLNPKAHPWVED
jgi:hypothetical protein